MDKLLVFCGKLETTLQEKHKSMLLVHIGGGVLSEVLEEKWGEMEGKWGKTLVDGFTSMWFMIVCASCTCVLCT